MALRVTQPFVSTFAISISFMIGAPVLTFIMLLASNLAGNGFGAMQRPADWFGICITVAAYATFAGILVDLLRLVTNLFWREKTPFSLRLGKVLRDNLA